MKIKKLLKKYRLFIILLIFNLMLAIISPQTGMKSMEITRSNLIEMLSVIPPIFILLGLLDVWVEKESMMKYLGKGSGLKGILIAFILGSAAAGPLYAAFPVATVMLKKRASIFNTFIFIGAWSTTKIPMLTFEATNLGIHFAAIRLLFSIVGIIMIACCEDRMLSEKEKEQIYSEIS